MVTSSHHYATSCSYLIAERTRKTRPNKTMMTIPMFLKPCHGQILVLVILFLEFIVSAGQEDYISAVGDSGMRRDGLRVALEAWNQCNEVGEEAPGMGSPRRADCFDVNTSASPIRLHHRVIEAENELGQANGSAEGIGSMDANQYAAWKENPWQFWMIMLKSGNTDTLAAVCPMNGKKIYSFRKSKFPCFGKGCMNMPLMYHNYTSLQECQGITCKLRGSFYGTWDLEADIAEAAEQNGTSYYAVTWEKEAGHGSWSFHHLLKTSSKYPWLMLYLRADSTRGLSAGYHFQTRGMLKVIPKSPDFKVKLTLDIRHGGGPKSQFYLIDIGSCWKNNGQPCNGDVTTDVTRYTEMIINPKIGSWCNPGNLVSCPVYHTLSNGTRVHRKDKANFPYKAYHLYCTPGNAKYPEAPYSFCDPQSNPQPQEILQILPHPVWEEYGYPRKMGEGWVGDPRTWELDAGRLSQALYFYQDPNTLPAKRFWLSVAVGAEIFVSENEIVEWTLKDFDVIILNRPYSKGTCLTVELITFLLIVFLLHAG